MRRLQRQIDDARRAYRSHRYDGDLDQVAHRRDHVRQASWITTAASIALVASVALAVTIWLARRGAVPPTSNSVIATAPSVSKNRGPTKKPRVAIARALIPIRSATPFELLPAKRGSIRLLCWRLAETESPTPCGKLLVRN